MSAVRLANFFHTTPEHIRVLAHRQRHVRHARHAPRAVANIRQLDVGLRLSGKQRHRLNALADRIAQLRIIGVREYTYRDTIARLRALRPYFGNPANPATSHLLATLHQHIAWFALHSGFSATALREATEAVDRFRGLYRVNGAQQDLQGVIDAALIAAQACYLAGQPRQTLTWLSLVRRAAEPLGGVGTDYYRQRGVALFQLSEHSELDEEAARAFRAASNAAERDPTIPAPIAVRMNGARQLHLLGQPDAAAARELHHDAQTIFGAESLEASMTAHWAAACGFSTDSDEEQRAALELVESNRSVAQCFGHQATVSYLFNLTPVLELDLPVRRAWIRHALYVNAFRGA